MSASTPKTMSSRLMTMKFMQRSAAKSTASSPSTTNGPPSKKVRLSTGGSAPGTPTSHDHEILQTALAEEARKQQEASDKAAQYSGETKWVLSFKDDLSGKRHESMHVRKAGFAEIDAEDDSDDEEEDMKPTRMQFGGGIKKKSDTTVPFEKAEDSEGEISSSDEELDSDDPTAALIRETKREVAAERRESRKARASMGNDSPRAPLKPLDEDMYVGNLTSLSGGAGGSKPAGRDMSNVACYQCGQKGHMATSCPKRSTPRGSAGRGKGKSRR
ncbi:hypothetical protein T440DRAFT_522892 [Plenodomus tracheiphilus IPT5]|uniref:CCHC-type domain-containing protein n=1 Tax=Plenodomus tracheiphilus IPT5 TaxID=1408161 RepID=A0A6A7APD4_9PLEO|nr:hypothetical protein T440DRAFT_522892 [Plenodomus tracheiphilus IPT5]